MSERASARLKALQVKKGNMDERQANRAGQNQPPQNPQEPGVEIKNGVNAPNNEGVVNNGDDNTNINAPDNKGVIAPDNEGVIVDGPNKGIIAPGDENINIDGPNKGIIVDGGNNGVIVDGPNKGVIGDDNINVEGPNKGIINDGNNNENANNTGKINIDNTNKPGYIDNTYKPENNFKIEVGEGNVWAPVDNSNRVYGGDNRSLIINNANTGTGGGDNGGYFNLGDQAVTMGTLGGFWDADDSPAGQAKFVDQQVTMNRDNQKRYAGMGLALAGQLAGFRGGDVNRAGLDYATTNMSNKFFDMATDAEAKTFGDRWHYTNKDKGIKFRFGDPIEEVNADAAVEAAKEAEDELD